METTDPAPRRATSLALMRAAFESPQYAELLTSDVHHDAALSFVARIVPYTDDPELIEAIIASALPEGYDGDTLKQIPEMVRSAVRNGFADRPTRGADGKVPSQLDIALGAVKAGDLELFHDQRGRGFIGARQPSGGIVSYAIRSREAEHVLRGLALKRTGRGISANQLKDLVETLDAMAVHQHERRQVVERIGGDRQVIYHDLGRADGLAVRIDGTDWTTTYDCPLRFYRAPGFGELPIPERGGRIADLKAFLALDELRGNLLLAFILNCLRPKGPYCCLLIEGEQGSGKSFVCRIIKAIVDPNEVAMMRLPDTDRDLMLQAKEFALCVYDNVSGMKGDLSDALCSLATGAGVATRECYTDGRLYTFKVARPFIINGIAEFVNRPDLLNRAIPLVLEPMLEENRKTEGELEAEFSVLLPRLMGALYDAVAGALANLPQTPPPKGIRMADAAHWIAAVDERQLVKSKLLRRRDVVELPHVPEQLDTIDHSPPLRTP